MVHYKEELINFNSYTDQDYYKKITTAISNSLTNVHITNQSHARTSIISDHTRKLISRGQELHNIKPKSRTIRNEKKNCLRLERHLIPKEYAGSALWAKTSPLYFYV